MPSAANAKLQYEGGQSFTAMSSLTDSGDHTLFTSTASLWSKKTGYAPDVRPNGLISGGAVIPAAAGGNNNVDVAALSCYLAGVKSSVSASANVAASRGATLASRITSITVTSAGAIAAVAGTEGASFSETRAAAGGPPLIPAGSIEVAQVRLASLTAAPVQDSEVFAVVGVHQERWDYPLWEENTAEGTITFNAALPLIHTGNIAKAVYASYAEPIFSDVARSSDFVPPETTNSVSSTQIYGATLGSNSSSLGQGSFTAFMQDGVGDALVGLAGENLWFKFFPDRYAANHLLCQGILGIARTFPAGGNITAKCTISAETAATEVVA